jgi:hypothetical protein
MILPIDSDQKIIQTEHSKIDENNQEIEYNNTLRKKLGSCFRETILNSTMHGKFHNLILIKLQ